MLHAVRNIINNNTEITHIGWIDFGIQRNLETMPADREFYNDHYKNEYFNLEIEWDLSEVECDPYFTLVNP